MDKIGFHRPLAFDLEQPARLEAEGLAQGLARRRGDMDAAWRTVALHALCRIHGVAPDIVDKFVGAEHAGDQRPGV